MLKTTLIVIAALVGMTPASHEPPTREGVDVSHWQGEVRWPEVAGDDVTFAFAKATEGDRYTDPRFHYNWREMKKAGLIRGAYHFLDPSINGAIQAAHFLHVVSDLEAGDFIPAVDVERMKRSSNHQLARVVDEFVGEIKKRTGLECIIYVSPAFWKEHLLVVQSGMRHQPLWVAEYDTNKIDSLKDLPAWTIWQFTRKGRLAGIDGYCDRLKGRSLSVVRIPADWKRPPNRR